ncbi:MULTISPECIES: SDR family NAD(P)-dependent oxidoreductase [unclassified Sphingomonas]|uniref:SDR family NAD(P)-dependent oxidoreductase n=1 Tax=unclassified Sphingomonas TaxID=196159 RepID=UPI002150DB9D|nr:MULTISPECIES: SDR family NAD(P)-dependent oxidoreductase [unclassified Sphingomonas]MCR5870926.1 SDR family oxidoreductase [Sphingomonas sp. J344]UUY00754.1 SDR family oxidoreductase [Sphingomonas sp. J315]
MTNPMNLSGRTILITGAAQGIGLATAQLCAALDANVILLDRSEEQLDAALASFDSGKAMKIAGSVTDRAFVKQAVAEAAARFGGIHGLVNNAGITRTAMIDKMTADDWQAVIDVNLTGAFNMLQAVGMDMIARAKSGESDPGAIVNISSDAGRKGTIGQINYGAAKSGVLGLTMSAAREWGRYGIRTNSVAYGIVETDMTETVRSEKFRDRYLANIPLGRFLTKEEAANSIAFLLSPAAAFITGQHLSVNGGSHITA